ncbi:MAG TPA: hypothetical protein VGX71_01230 [Pseudaminobacter sp.]|jgi:hypothetical protein|nr:hypothetical protein [Pseudaminobacter sp.]
MRKASGLLILVSVSAFASIVSAQDRVPPNPGAVVSPNGDLPLRANPPGFFSGKGEVIGTIQPTDNFIVLEQRTVPSIFGNQQWLRVQPVQPAPDSNAGWVYSGPADQMQNFTVQSLPDGGMR